MYLVCLSLRFCIASAYLSDFAFVSYISACSVTKSHITQHDPTWIIQITNKPT